MNSKSETQASKVDIYKLISAATLFVIAVGAFYYFAEYPTAVRTIGLLVATGGAIALAATTVLGEMVIGFLKDSRMELRKVVWPTRQETVQTSIAVIVMVVVMGIFLWLLDVLLFWLMSLLTGHR